MKTPCDTFKSMSPSTRYVVHEPSKEGRRRRVARRTDLESRDLPLWQAQNAATTGTANIRLLHLESKGRIRTITEDQFLQETVICQTIQRVLGKKRQSNSTRDMCQHTYRLGRMEIDLVDATLMARQLIQYSPRRHLPYQGTAVRGAGCNPSSIARPATADQVFLDAANCSFENLHKSSFRRKGSYIPHTD